MRSIKWNIGKKLNPERSPRTTRGIKGTRQTEIVTHDPSMINQNELLLVKFPNLGSDDVIVPGTANLSFNIELSSEADPRRALMSNMGRATVKKLSVKFDENEIFDVNNSDVFAYYQDLRKIDSEKRRVRQGIIHSGGCNENCMKL